MSAPEPRVDDWERLFSVISFMKQQAGDAWTALYEWVVEKRREAAIAHEEAVKAKSAAGGYTDAELVYAATARCPCGAGLAYPKGIGGHGSWDCADILTGRAIASGQEGAKEHTDRLPFAFWEVKSENQPSQNGATTRPKAEAA